MLMMMKREGTEDIELGFSMAVLTDARRVFVPEDVRLEERKLARRDHLRGQSLDRRD